MHVYVLKRSNRLADTVQYDMPYPDVCVCVCDAFITSKIL